MLFSSLALLFVGFLLSLPKTETNEIAGLSSASRMGIGATALGAVSMSLNGVYFERASNAMVDTNVFWQSFQCGLWGICFNGLVFCAKVQSWRGAFHGFDGRTSMAVLGIVG